MTDFRENIARVDYDEVHYWTNEFSNARPSLVMIHGFRGDHHGLLKIAQLLADDYNLFIPDLPGFGRTKPLRYKRHNLESYADSVHRFVRSLVLAKKPSIFGHSFGTTIVSAYAAEHANDVDKVVLLSPIAARPSPKIADPLIRIISAVPERAGRRLTGNRLVSDAMTRSTKTTKDKELARWIKSEHRQHFNDFASHKTMMEAMQASNTHHVAQFAHLVPNQTLIIAGDRDKIGKSKAQIGLAGLFDNATTKIIPGVGHLTHYEVPGEVAEAIKRFV
jgi:pimeloyl-ACP methyl ester carboxylesterase